MPRPEIVEPKTIREAIQALRARPRAVPLAGATDVIPAMVRGEIRPRLLVNLKQISELSGIRRVRGGVRIGALTRIAEVAENSLVAGEFPILAEVADGFGSVQVRNLATIGGNLCNAAPSADFALPLLVLEAEVEIHGPGGVRRLDLPKFFRGVNRTALRRGEIVSALLIPRPPARTGAAYAKLGIRRAMDLSLVGVAAAVTLIPEDRSCRRARIALGAVSPVPMRAHTAESVLEGKTITAALAEEASAAAAAEARPVSDLRASADYRRDMTQVLTRRVLREALRRARGKESRDERT